MKFDEVKNSGNMISSNVSGEYVEAFEEYWKLLVLNELWFYRV